MTTDELEEWVARSRAAQGLPPKVTDPVALARVARLIVQALDRERRQVDLIEEAEE